MSLSAQPAPRAPQRRGRDGTRTREAIEREALRLFAAKGVDATSTKDIAQAVGVAEAALYRHFASKESMAQAIFARHYAALARDIRAIAERPQSFAARVDALVGLFCGLFDAEPDVFAFLLLNQHAHLRFVPEDPQANVVEALRGLMEEACTAGETLIADADLAAAIGLGIVVQPALFRLYGRMEGPMMDVKDELTRAVLRALGAA